MSSRDRHRAPKPLRRRTEVRPERRTIRIYSEGTATEPEYFDAIKRLPQVAGVAAIEIDAQSGATPRTLVQKACDDKRRSDLEIEEIWCVFDVESPKQHPDLKQACQQARDNDIHVAISNPCFELWLILHSQDQRAFLTTHQAVHLRKRIDGAHGKHLDPSLYMSKRADAIRRARRLTAMHAKNNSPFPDDNPSSTVYELLESLERTSSA